MSRRSEAAAGAVLKAHVQQGERPPRAVQLGSPLHYKTARLVEAASRWVLLVDIIRQLSVEFLRMPHQPTAEVFSGASGFHRPKRVLVRSRFSIPAQHLLYYNPLERISLLSSQVLVRAEARQSMTDPLPHTSGQPVPLRPTFARPLLLTKKRLGLALVLAVLSDAIGAFVTPMPPFSWVVDLITAIVLFMVLGWQWLLLPGILLEAIPGVGVLPFWILVVVAIALWGTAHPKWTQ